MLEDAYRVRREELRALITGRCPAELTELIEQHGEDAAILLTPDDWQSVLQAYAGIPAGVAWRCLASSRFAGVLASAADVYEAIDPEISDPADLAIAMALHAEALSRTGDDEAAGHLLRAAAELSIDDRARAYRMFGEERVLNWAGQYGSALRTARDGLALAMRAEDRVAEVMLRTSIVWNLRAAGRYAEAVVEADRGLDLAEELGTLSARAFLRAGKGVSLNALGRLDDALAELRGAVDDWIELGSPQAAQGWSLVGEVQRERGNISLAEDALRRALELSRDSDIDRRMLGILRADLAACVAAEDPEEARSLAEEALASGPFFNEAKVRVATAWTFVELGDLDRARDLAAEVTAGLGRQERDPATMAYALLLQALTGSPDARRLAREAQSIWREIGHAVQDQVSSAVLAHLDGDRHGESLALDGVRRLGVHDDAALAAGPLRVILRDTSAPPIRIRMLGAFALELDGEVVRTWPSKKARDLLKILVDSGPHGIRREAAADLLWPAAGPVGNKLSVTLSQLRSVLDPAKVQAADAYVVADRDRIRLDDTAISIDVNDFRDAAATAFRLVRDGASHATQALMSAVALHGGEYLFGDAYADWAAAGREEVERIGADLLRALAMRLVVESPSSALPWLSRLISQDPYDEPAQRAMIALLVSEGRHGEARRAYRTFCERMVDLGLPAPDWADVIETSPA